MKRSTAPASAIAVLKRSNVLFMFFELQCLDILLKAYFRWQLVVLTIKTFVACLQKLIYTLMLSSKKRNLEKLDSALIEMGKDNVIS